MKERFLKSDKETDREKAKDQYDTLFSCHKQRETGEEPSYALWFDPRSCQFLEKNDVEPKRYIFDREAGVSK